MKAGQPTKFSNEVLTKTQKYIDACEDSYETISYREGKHIKYERKKIVNLPTIEGLAYELHVHKDTVYQWRKSHEKFSDLIARLLAKQAKRLVNNGMSGDYNPTIAKVLLTKHGYREGLEHTGNDGEDLFKTTKEDQDKAKDALKNM